MIITHSMMVFHAHHLATNSQGQGHKPFLKGMKRTKIYRQLYCPYPHNRPRVGVKRPKQFFSENGHVVYQIKGNNTYNNMQAIILSLHTPSTLSGGVKGRNSFFFFLKMVMLQINLKGMKRTIT